MPHGFDFTSSVAQARHLPLKGKAFFGGAPKLHLYIICVSPTGKFRQNRRNGIGKPVPYRGAAVSGALPPLCKGRWVGVSRAGGVACSNPCGIAAHITYSLFTCRRSLHFAFPLAEREGKVSPSGDG